VEAADPLAVAAVGLGPALDLAGEGGGGHDGLEPGLDECEVEDVAVHAAGLQRHGGDPAPPEPGDEVAEPGGVGGELADGVGPVGRLPDAHPVGGVADVDAGGVGIADGGGGEPGDLLGLAADAVGVAVGGRSGFALAGGHAGLQNGGAGRRDVRRDGGVGTGTSRSSGIRRGCVRRSPSGGPKALPGPVEPTGRARGSTHQKRDGPRRRTRRQGSRRRPQVPGRGGQPGAGRLLNQTLHLTPPQSRRRR
jgi:hypothetical protein